MGKVVFDISIARVPVFVVSHDVPEDPPEGGV
jgi:hypothetical protein